MYVFVLFSFVVVVASSAPLYRLDKGVSLLSHINFLFVCMLGVYIYIYMHKNWIKTCLPK